MKKTFWLLDVNYEVKGHLPEMWIWGIDEEEKRILIIDRNFLPYFYILVDEKTDPEVVMEQIESRKSGFPFLVKLELVDRRSFGKAVKVIKAFCQDPDLVSDYSKRMRKIRGVKKCFEDDIRYSMRYLIDNGITPCGWHEAEVERTENVFEAQVNKVYLAKSFPKSIEKTEIPPLRILGYSMICYSQKAAEFVRQHISDLRGKKVPYKNLIIWKTLTRPVEKYAVRAAHVETAKMLMKEGWDLSVGDKVGYVIISGPGRLYEKARPYVMASYDDVDIEYYVSNQVLPAASRILSMFDITEDELLPTPSKPPSTLLEFTES